MSDVAAFEAELQAIMSENGWFCGSFRVGDYNDHRFRVAPDLPSSLLSAPADATAYILASHPGFLKQLQNSSLTDTEQEEHIDSAVDSIIARVAASAEAIAPVEVVYARDPPYKHVQTMGYLAGIVEHVSPAVLTDQEAVALKEAAGIKHQLQGVSMHPVYGGWFYYRAAVVLSSVPFTGEAATPLEFLSRSAKVAVLTNFNCRGEPGAWRDLPEDVRPCNATSDMFSLARTHTGCEGPCTLLRGVYPEGMGERSGKNNVAMSQNAKGSAGKGAGSAGGSSGSTRGAGPSGKPFVHHIDYNSKHAAEQAARRAGEGSPLHHPTGAGSGHYHAVDRAGNKIVDGLYGGVHFRYGSR